MAFDSERLDFIVKSRMSPGIMNSLHASNVKIERCESLFEN